MSTYDVPGHNKQNSDELAMGCWAEHEDGSLILVQSTEDDRVIYEMFDTAKNPVVNYRDAMPIKEFKKSFSWSTGKSKEKWLWKDKTPFDWNRVIKAGASDGVRYVTAADQISAAQSVAQSLQLRASELSQRDIDHLVPKQMKKAKKLMNQLQKVISKLPV